MNKWPNPEFSGFPWLILKVKIYNFFLAKRNFFGVLLKRKILYLFLIFSILSSYATIIDLADGYKIEGEIVSAQKNEISLVTDNLLLLISKSVIEEIHTDDKRETIPA